MFKFTYVANAFPQINLDNRFPIHNGSTCLLSVDGTNFWIRELIPFDTKWFPHKLNGPGVRYEIGTCIQTGWIVWANGPFPCGEWSDLAIVRSSLMHLLESWERCVADGGGAPRQQRISSYTYRMPFIHRPPKGYG